MHRLKPGYRPRRIQSLGRDKWWAWDLVNSAYLDTLLGWPLSSSFPPPAGNFAYCTMFEFLSDKLKRTLKNLRGEGVLTKEHVDAALREIRLALLEADVNYKVAKDFIASVKEKAEGQQVWLELKPSEQVVKIVFDELVELLGGQSSRLVFTKTSPNVVMIVGLQGSGKTTSTGKIARWLAQNQERKPLLLSTDVYRPAAREQLRVIAHATGQSIFEKPETNDPIELTRSALQHARDT